MKEADNLYNYHQCAKEYIARITPPKHMSVCGGRDDPKGRLRSLTLTTEILYRPFHSADTEVYKDSIFDRALAEVIKKHFPELSGEALAYMKQKADEALIAEKKELQERLSKIEELEKQMEVQV